MSLCVDSYKPENYATGWIPVRQAKLVHALQSKLAVSTGGVKKHSKKGKKALKAIALKDLEAAAAQSNADKSRSHSPSPSSSSPGDVEEEQEPRAGLGSSSNYIGVSQQAEDSSYAAEGSPKNSSVPERQKSASPVSSTSDGGSDGSGGPSGPKDDTEAASENSIDPQGITTVPSSTAFKRLVKRCTPLGPDSRSAPEAAGGVQGLTPSQNTPSKATPNKRPREAVCSSPAANSPVVGVEHHRGPEGGLPEGTPGKRRRSLLPQSTPVKEASQVAL